MPIYEFRCGACGERFEAPVGAGTRTAVCRVCGAEGATRVLSRRQERGNADLRRRTKADFNAARRRARDAGGRA